MRRQMNQHRHFYTVWRSSYYGCWLEQQSGSFFLNGFFCTLVSSLFVYIVRQATLGQTGWIVWAHTSLIAQVNKSPWKKMQLSIPSVCALKTGHFSNSLIYYLAYVCQLGSTRNTYASGRLLSHQDGCLCLTSSVFSAWTMVWDEEKTKSADIF